MLSTHELLELASLDALGLLDIEEREAFERGFRAAAPNIQAQIRREQLRCTMLDAGTPMIDPPLGLKARVLAAVREAMESVGTKRVSTNVGVNGELALAGGVAGLVGGPALRSSSGVHRYWRAAAIGSVAAALVFAFTTLQVKSENQLLSAHLQSNALADHLLKEFGTRFDQSFFDPSTRMVSFAPALQRHKVLPGGVQGKAALLIDPVNKRAQLFLKDMPSGGSEYEVVVVDSDGKHSKAVLTFRPASSGIKQHTIEGLNVEADQTIAIRRVGDTDPWLVSRRS